MKKGKIFILILMSIFIKSYGQKIDLSNTKDLISISKSEGLISALSNLDLYPMYYIDRPTTNELLKQTLLQPYSSEIESFLLNLTLDDRLPELAKPLNNLIKLKSKKALETDVEVYSKIDKNEMYTILNNHNQHTEYYLIQYYKTWLGLAKKNRANYALCKADSLKLKETPLNIPFSNKIFDLMKPYKTCNYNCYMIMLTLKKMGSYYANDRSLYYHKKVGEALDVNMTIFKHEKGNTFLKKATPRTIKLNKRYDTIKDIDFANELNFKNKYLKDMNSDFGIYGFYKQKSGIISICHNDICNYYLIKLVDDKKLKIYETTMCTVTTD
ncbi:MAG: hypothetical protein PHT07_00080 [Paludibacter sp.]|nr:hypothetical protein [Paludibacter sp.]